MQFCNLIAFFFVQRCFSLSCCSIFARLACHLACLNFCSSAPHTIRNLKYTTTEEWKDFFRVSQNKDASDTQQYGVPSRVIRSPDGRKFGLSAIPDKVYRIWFYAYDLPTELDAFGDAIVFADTYKPVLLARARYYMHQFKENSQAAAFALDDYKRGLKLMRLHLMEPAPGYFKDDRMRFV